MATLTSANSVLALGVVGIYDTPQVLQGYEVDDGVISQAVSRIETRQGLDGFMAAGKVFNPYIVEIHLMPTSPSVQLFEDVINAQEGAREVYQFFGTITLSGINRVYTFVNGYLTSETPFAAVRKTLQPLVYQLTFEAIIPSSY